MSKQTFPTLSRAIEGFLLHKSASGRSHYTLRNYRTQLIRFADWLDNPPIDKINSKQNEAFFMYLREDYRINGICHDTKKLSPKTIKNAWAALSTFWKWACREFELENPFKVPHIKANTKPIHPISMEEIQTLLKACEYTDELRPRNRRAFQYKRPTFKRDRAIILSLVDTGVRVSELCNANVGDLDIETGRLIVTGKGNKTRFVYLGKLARQAVWQYLVERYPDSKPEEDESLFVNRFGIHRLNRHGVRSLLRGLGDKVGIEGLHPHRFRHTFAIEFLRNGGDVFTLQQLLGHSSLEMVKKYLRLAEMDLERVHRKASPADNWRLR